MNDYVLGSFVTRLPLLINEHYQAIYAAIVNAPQYRKNMYIENDSMMPGLVVRS